MKHIMVENPIVVLVLTLEIVEVHVVADRKDVMVDVKSPIHAPDRALGLTALGDRGALRPRMEEGNTPKVVEIIGTAISTPHKEVLVIKHLSMVDAGRWTSCTCSRHI